jgi:superfamily II DNA or RNA helicase
MKWMLGEARQREVMESIHQQLFPSRGIRMRIQDIPDFPKVDIQAELYDIGHEHEINQLYQELGALDKDPENPLTKRLRLRQKIELLKVPLAEQLTRDYRAKGFSVSAFCNFSATLEALAGKLKTNCVLSGTNTQKERDANVDLFQRNEVGEILVNTKVGGAGLSLPDLDGQHPRVGLVFPSDSVLDMEQIFGRLPRTDSKSTSYYRVLLANGTVEVKTYSAFKRHSNNIRAMNNGDLRPEL